MTELCNANVEGFEDLITPAALKTQLPISAAAKKTVLEGRSVIRDILTGDDRRKLMIVGPCSIHNTEAALAYAQKLKDLTDEVSDQLYVVMRVYFEKPRTTLAWKGLINDPHLNGSFDMNTGFRRARDLLLRINGDIGLPAGTEFLDPFTVQYLDDLVCWAAIGARTTESQTHRQMASGLSMPAGFKNDTRGGTQNAVNGIHMAGSPQKFIGMDEHNQVKMVSARGNTDGHLILRGGERGTNYDPESVNNAAQRLEDAGLHRSLIVDCSHANSGKDHTQQAAVLRAVIEQWEQDGAPVVGAMIESNLESGKQKLPDPDKLPAGKTGHDYVRTDISVTDSCISFMETTKLLQEAHRVLCHTKAPV